MGDNFTVVREIKEIPSDKYRFLKTLRLIVYLAMNHIKDETERTEVLDEAEEHAKSIGFGMLDLVVSIEIFNANYKEAKK